jgi:hypothetical protein
METECSLPHTQELSTCPYPSNNSSDNNNNNNNNNTHLLMCQLNSTKANYETSTK